MRETFMRFQVVPSSREIAVYMSQEKRPGKSPL